MATRSPTRKLSLTLPLRVCFHSGRQILSQGPQSTAMQLSGIIACASIVDMQEMCFQDMYHASQLPFPAGTKTVITAAAKAKVQRVVLTSSVVTLFGETPNPPKGPILGPSDFNEVASMKPGDHYEPYAYGKVGLTGSKKRQTAQPRSYSDRNVSPEPTRPGHDVSMEASSQLEDIFQSWGFVIIYIAPLYVSMTKVSSDTSLILTVLKCSGRSREGRLEARKGAGGGPCYHPSFDGHRPCVQHSRRLQPRFSSGAPPPRSRQVFLNNTSHFSLRDSVGSDCLLVTCGFPLLQGLLAGKSFATIYTPLQIDSRDVAAAHVAAAEIPSANVCILHVRSP